jgi:hypothetical protein
MNLAASTGVLTKKWAITWPTTDTPRSCYRTSSRQTFPYWFGPDEQFWRRTAVRAAFGAIEGWCSWIRAEMPPLVEGLRAAGVLAPEEEQKAAALFKATDRHEIALDDKGLPRKQNRKTSLRPMFRAMVRLYSLGRAIGSGYADKHFSKDGWTQLQLAVKVRDRLTHPHGANDILVSQDDLYAVREGINWFIELVKDIDAEHARFMEALKNGIEIVKARETPNG